MDRTIVMDRASLIQFQIIYQVVENQRGDDDAHLFLFKIRRTLDDMLKGRAVRPWRLERTQRFFDEISKICLYESQARSDGCF